MTAIQLDIFAASHVGIEVYVFRIFDNPDKRFSVTVKDTDADEYLPTVRYFPEYTAARDYASTLAAKM